MTEKMKKKLMILFFLLTINLSQASFSFIQPEDSNDLLAIDAALSNFQGSEQELPPSKKEILERFCSTALQDHVSKGFNAEQDQYSSQNSLFMRLLCKESKILNDESDFSPFLDDGEKSYFLKNAAKSIHFPAKCQTPELGECKFDQLGQLLITKTLDELFATKQANIYGLTDLNFTSQQKVEGQVNNFAQHYFFQGDWKVTDDFCQGNQHKYPKTCNIMKNNLKAFKNVFKKFKILNTKTLFTDSEEKLKKNKNPENDYCYFSKGKEKEYDYLFCALLHTNNRGLEAFKNIIYNELLRYNIFSSYAGHQLGLNPNPTQIDIQEIKNIKKYQTEIPEFANITLEQISQLKYSYPLHIGMLMYQEDLLKLRNDYLSKLVNPFYSLFFKLQNVQIPS